MKHVNKYGSFTDNDIEEVHAILQEFIDDNNLINDEPNKVAKYVNSNIPNNERNIYYYMDTKFESRNVINISISYSCKMVGGMFGNTDPRITKIYKDINQMLERFKSMDLNCNSGTDKILNSFFRTWITIYPSLESIKSFESFIISGDREKQITTSDEAREVLSEIYEIVDEVEFASFKDFLVPPDEFIDYSKKYNGNFAGNVFDSIEELQDILELEIEFVSPIFYMAPFWFTRTKSDIVDFKEVYSDTIYIKLLYDLNEKEIKKIRKKLEADECHIMNGLSGDTYLRVWWD